MKSSPKTKIKVLGSILLIAFCLSGTVLAVDTGWLQTGVRLWYVGGVGSVGSEDAETAVVIDRFENGAAYMTQHSAINYWKSPMAPGQVVSPNAASEGAFWINPAQLAALYPPAVFTWKDQVYVVSRATYTPATLPFLYLLPEEALFTLSPYREIITLTYSKDEFTGDYFFDVETGLLLSQTESLTSGSTVTTTALTLSEINYDFYTHTAFAEDYGLHTAFCGYYSASRSLGFGLGTQAYQLTPAVLSRYKNKVLIRHSGIFSDTNWLFPVSFNQYVSYYSDLQKAYLSDDGTNWVENGDHIYIWMPPADRLTETYRSSSQIEVWDIAMDRTSTGVFTAPTWPTVPGFYVLAFDSSGYVSDMCPVWPSLNFYVASWLDSSKVNRMDGLSYYQDTITPAQPSTGSIVSFDSSTYSADETAGTVTLTVTRVNNTSGICSVNYATSDGTACAGTDYTAASGTLSWSAGDSASKTITISLLNSGASGKTFGVTLSDALGAILGYISGATVTITATPSAPTGVTASNGTYTDKVRITWNSVSGATSYLIFRSLTNTTGSAAQINTSTTASYDDPAATNWPGITLYYWVKAKNSLATSDYSASGHGYCAASSILPVSGDIEGDRLADLISVVSTNWYVWFSSAQYLVRGGPYVLDISGTPATGDIDGDGKADFISVVGSNWYVWFSTAQYLVRGGPYDMGISGAPTTGDIDGDGLADLITVVGSNWYVWFSTAQYLVRGGPYDMGISGTPLTGDVDGDGLADLISVVGSNWYVWFSTAQYLVRGGPYDMGISGIPTTGDIDGDDKADFISVVGSDWYVWFSTAQYLVRGGPYTLSVP